MHGSVKEKKTRNVFTCAPILGTYTGGTKKAFSDNSPRRLYLSQWFLEISFLLISMSWWQGLPVTTYHQREKIQMRFHCHQASRRLSMITNSPPLPMFPPTRVQGPFSTHCVCKKCWCLCASNKIFICCSYIKNKHMRHTKLFIIFTHILHLKIFLLTLLIFLLNISYMST